MVTITFPYTAKNSLDLKVRLLIKDINIDVPFNFIHIFETRIKEISSGNHIKPEYQFITEMNNTGSRVTVFKLNINSDRKPFAYIDKQTNNKKNNGTK